MGEQATPFQHSVHTVGRSMGGWPGKPPNDRDERVSVMGGTTVVSTGRAKTPLITSCLVLGSTIPTSGLVSEHLTMSGVFARVDASDAFRNCPARQSVPLFYMG